MVSSSMRELNFADTKLDHIIESHWSWGEVLNNIEPEYTCLAFLHDGRVKGAISWRSEANNTLHISKIETFPLYRSTGVGKIFMDELKQYAKGKGFDMIDAWCELSVVSYYSKMGFYKTQDTDHVSGENIIRVEYKL